VNRKEQDKLLSLAGLGVLAWIVYKNWTRKGGVEVESVESTDWAPAGAQYTNTGVQAGP
jgi:hypothetical protein